MAIQPTLKFTILAVCLASVVGCGSDSLPSSPSASMAVPLSGSGGATVSGTVNASGGAGLSPLFAVVTSGGITVSIVGTGLSTATDAAGRFVLNGVPAGDIQIQFMGPNVNATITISAVQRSERIEIVVVTNGSAAELESNSRRGADGKVEIEGRIFAVDDGTRMVQIFGFADSVHVPESAVIRHGSQKFTFADLDVGDRVHIRGTPGSPTIEAQEIELQNPAGPGPAGNEVELEGIVQSPPTGSCSARNLSFTVNKMNVMTSVLTDGSTIFKDGLCGDIKMGTRVEVKGRLQQNGTVLATRVEIEHENEIEEEVELKGTVQNLAGSCPNHNLSFRLSVGGPEVMTNGSTQFRDGPCSAIANGIRVEVKGRRQNGKVLATRVEIEDEIEDELELKGTVQNTPGGSCPNLTFRVSGTEVMTSGSTQFRDGSCNAIKMGTRVEVKGRRQNGRVLATRVEIDKD